MEKALEHGSTCCRAPARPDRWQGHRWIRSGRRFLARAGPPKSIWGRAGDGRAVACGHHGMAAPGPDIPILVSHATHRLQPDVRARLRVVRSRDRSADRGSRGEPRTGAVRGGDCATSADSERVAPKDLQRSVALADGTGVEAPAPAPCRRLRSDDVPGLLRVAWRPAFRGRPRDHERFRSHRISEGAVDRPSEGPNDREKIRCHFGRLIRRAIAKAAPEDEVAEKYRLPIVTLIDTPGPTPA